MPNHVLRHLSRLLIISGAVVVLTACLGAPKDVQAVQGFDAQRYMGTWYEIARLDHRFERGMTDVKAVYGLRDDGRISVVNSGIKAGKPKTITGSAKAIGDAGQGSLAVTFFPPFAGGYHVIWIDGDYEHAVVSGPTRNYLWLLSRHAHPDPVIVKQMTAFATSQGFATDQLIMVSHQTQAP